jgi:ferredoxin/coenzyme F420-reducing hydrogenase delta subunit
MTAGGVTVPRTADDVRGGSALAWLERGFLYFDRLIGRVLPQPLNPFLQTGAVAIWSLAIATVTGVLLLIWYRPSVHLAYESVEVMSSLPWTAGLLRSLHRYSSDACMFFALVHALRVLLGRRFVAARWLAWVGGVLSLVVLWLVGWTGYWLVWDARAQHIAVGTAALLDSVPIFVDQMGRAFLTDGAVNSLLFFVVFFVHMLFPLALAVLLWLHLTRLSRPHFLTSTPMAIWVTGSLLMLCIAYPADSAEPARMAARWASFDMDWWYLLPLALTDRLSGGMLWSLLLGGGVVALSVPWWLGRGKPIPAHIDPKRCNGCEQCFADCPYAAISMVPRTEGPAKYALQAEVDPARCVACGICAGSCDSVAVEIPRLEVPEQRERLENWVKEDVARAEPRSIAFVCAHSAGADLSIDSDTGLCAELPGYRVLRVTCAGWLHALTVERVLRLGADRALVVTCASGECHFREGDRWTRQRLDGERLPMLRADKVDRGRISVLALDRTQKTELLKKALPAAPEPEERTRPSASLAGVVSVALALLVAAVVGAGSDQVYATPAFSGSELVVAFKHPGRESENCRELTEEEQAKLPVHMRREKICDRARASVRMRVRVDGRLLLDSVYPPSGIWSDGNSVAVERFRVSSGEHRVSVEIGDSADPDEWNHVLEQRITQAEAERRVITFDRVAGFGVH